MKTPSEKAYSLYRKYSNVIFNSVGGRIGCHILAVESSLLCVDEIINSNPTIKHGHLNGKDIVEKTVKHWEEVRKELEKMKYD